MIDLHRLLGSLIVCGFDGSRLPASLQSCLERQSLAGVILFSRNYETATKLQKLTGVIHAASQSPTFIAVDQEGGRVVRFSSDFPVFPSPRHFGNRDDLAGFLHGTAVTAKALRDHGVNLNLVPVCDLDPDDQEHVLHSRTYASDVQKVSNCVASQIEVLKSSGIMSCAKHFPGLASSVGDPHFQVAQSKQTLTEFRQRDYAPFKAAIAAGVDMVMPTHLRAPGLDEENIITFSRKILDEELRSYLGFEGLIISDDLQMLGALEGIDQIEAGTRALLAGCDLLIYANLQETLDNLLDGLVKRVDSDAGLRSRVMESRQRIVAFQDNKQQYFST